MPIKNVNQIISDIGIIPVITITNPGRDAAPLARALCDGDVPVAEITFRTPGAEKAIWMMRNACPEMIVGAGTVTTTKQIDIALATGGQFVVTPGFREKLVDYAQKKNIPIFPGCTTPTDYHAALDFGLEILKFFPAEQSGGLAKIKAMSAPFPQFKVMPTGGISLKNLGSYCSEPVIAACGGSYMATVELIENQNWDEITKLCKKSREIVEAARLGTLVKEAHMPQGIAEAAQVPGQYAENSTSTAQDI